MKITTENRADVLARLDEEIAEAKAEADAMDRTVYANSDWNSASRSKEKRLHIAREAVKAGATEVDPWRHHGVLIDNWLLIAADQQKWTYKMDKWYPFYKLDALLYEKVTDRA